MTTGIPRGPLPSPAAMPLDAAIAGAAAPAKPRWGGFATLLWGVPIVLAFLLANVFGVVLDLLWMQFGTGAGLPLDPATGEVEDSYWATLGTRPEVMIATYATLPALQFAVVGPAARLAGTTVRDYLALNSFSGRDLLVGVLALAGVVAGFEVAAALLGVSLDAPWLVELRDRAVAGGTLPLLVLSIAVAAPLCEEVVFRGFLFRGWSRTWLAPAGTIVLTSALWTAVHLQYDAPVLLEIFCIGLVLGWMRHRSGSTLLTVVLHAVFNLAACVEMVVARS